MYDPLLAKLTAWGETRASTIDRAIAALRDFPVLGIRSNVPFLIRVLDHREFREGNVHTGFIEEHLEELGQRPRVPREAAGAVLLRSRAARASFGETRDAQSASLGADPWSTLEGWGR